MTFYNGRKNKYFLDKESTKGLSIEQLRAAKFNNQFLMSVFTNLVAHDGTNAESVIGQDYITCLLDNKLPRSDAETGVSSKNLGAKLSFLIKTLRNNPEEQKKFQNSFFFQLIEVFRRGTINYDEQEIWSNYKPTTLCPDKYKKKGAFSIAMLCHSKNDSAPIGIDFSTLIDSLIDTDKNGNYFITTDFDKFGSEAQEMNNACKEYLKLIKSTPTFQSYFESEDGSAMYI